MNALIHRFWSDEAGATMIEYGLLVALISVAVLGSLAAFGEMVRDRLFQLAVDAFQ